MSELSPAQPFTAEQTLAPRVGAWVTLDAIVATEQIARAGFDYVCVDGQHGLLGYDAQVRALIAIAAGGAIPFARVSTNSAAEIGRVLGVTEARVSQLHTRARTALKKTLLGMDI